MKLKPFKLAGVGILSALAASLCCITPLLTIIAGTTGLASTFSWLEPFSPYFIILTIVVLTFTWYKKIKQKKDIDCTCKTNEKPKFIHSKFFLGIVTVLVIILLAIPYYSNFFIQKPESEKVHIDKFNIQTIEIPITGMTCNGCAQHVKQEVDKIGGIVNSNASYEKGNAIIQFDKSKTTPEEIKKTINATGYLVADKK